ncbi:MAG: homoserine O-acetyltransferase [Bacteroidetes bacterium]|nr:homoserine O-acetyltransferase [Bacteroidota bacterium]
MKAEQTLFTYEEPFKLESGAQLPCLQLAYHTWGEPNADWSNVVWVCHALTANANAADWWPGMVGPGCFYDPKDWYIICVNILGSCYGSLGPLSRNPATGRPFYSHFPFITVRDMVRAHDLLRQYLSIDHIHTLIGGSLGGQQALEWAVMQPQLVQHLVVLAVNARHSAWGIAFNTAQRMALEADPTWQDPRPDAGAAGLAAARAIAMLSYRSYTAYVHTQSEPVDDKTQDYRAESYQRYQGEKLCKRFNAQSYHLLSRAMDSHHLGRGRGALEQVLMRIQARTLVIGISSDGLFPVAEQQFLASHIPHARYVEIDSIFGHDGFLVEAGQISRAIAAFYGPQ